MHSRLTIATSKSSKRRAGSSQASLNPMKKSTTPLPKSHLISDFSIKLATTPHSVRDSISRFIPFPEGLSDPFGQTQSLKKLPTKLEILEQFASNQAGDPGLGTPATRKDVQYLAEWLTSMLQKAMSSTSSPESLYESANSIYKVCFQEVIRQVKVQCRERGELIMKIWETYQALFLQAIKITQTKQSFMEKQHLTEKNNIEISYEKKLKELMATNTELKKKSEKLEKDLKFKEDAYSIKLFRESKLLQALDLFKQQYYALKEEMLIIKEEHRIANIKLENLQNMKTRVYRKYKPKDAEFVRKSLETDPILQFQGDDPVDDLVKQIAQYGNLYAEKFEGELFTQHDFKDQETSTEIKEFVAVESYTDVTELCGESVGTKVRRKRRTKKKTVVNTFEMIMKQENETVFNANDNEFDLKRKHVYIKQLLQEINQVRIY